MTYLQYEMAVETALAHRGAHHTVFDIPQTDVLKAWTDGVSPEDFAQAAAEGRATPVQTLKSTPDDSTASLF